VVTQKKKKHKTAALELTFFLFFLFFYSFFSFLSSFLSFFQQQYNDKEKTLEQIDPQIYRIFRTTPSTNSSDILAANNVVTNYVTRTRNSNGLDTKTSNTT
jgi:predicted PurR-regulated permease PerM